jgi:hypothetical protein
VIERSAVANDSKGSTLAKLDDEEMSIGGIVNLVRDYAKQETLGPLKGAGKFLAFGVAGSLVLGLGLSLVLLGLLRLIQTEIDTGMTGRLSWLPYVIVLVVCVAVIVLALTRISKSSLNKEID